MNNGRQAAVMDMPLTLAIPAVDENENAYPVVIEEQPQRETTAIDLNSATEGRSIPDALAYHLACVDALRNVTGDEGQGVSGPPAVQIPSNQREGVFRRMRRTFD